MLYKPNAPRGSALISADLERSEMSCIIAVDIGNTSASIGIAHDTKITCVSRMHGGIRDRKVIRNTIARLARNRCIDGSVFCSVVPSANQTWISELKRSLGSDPLVVNHRLKLGIGISYPRPATIGADRLANACGAVSRYGAPVIVADFGTALTFDVISADGAYIGGVIAPGLPIMTDYLAEKAALLPRIRLKGPYREVGKNTVGAMRIGAKVGYRGMVREIVKYLKAGLRLKRVKLCATGGYAEWALDGLDMPFRFDPDLTLYGLSRIYELNVTRGQT